MKKIAIKYIQNINRKKLIIKIVFILAIIITTYNIIYIANTGITKNNYIEIFGISLFKIDNNYMKEDLRKNDLVIVKNVDKKNFKVDDIIAYKVNKQVKIDKVYKIIQNENLEGKKYVTKSNTALYPNSEAVQENEIIGKKILVLPILGVAIGVFQSRITTFTVFAFLLLLLLNVHYKANKSRQRTQKKKAFNLNLPLTF